MLGLGDTGLVRQKWEPGSPGQKEQNEQRHVSEKHVLFRGAETTSLAAAGRNDVM